MFINRISPIFFSPQTSLYTCFKHLLSRRQLHFPNVFLENIKLKETLQKVSSWLYSKPIYIQPVLYNRLPTVKIVLTYITTIRADVFESLIRIIRRSGSAHGWLASTDNNTALHVFHSQCYPDNLLLVFAASKLELKAVCSSPKMKGSG